MRFLIKIFCLINILLSLIIGGIIYYLDGNGTYIGNLLYCVLGYHNINFTIPSIFRNWGCDFLWAYAFSFAMLMSLYSSEAPYKKTFLVVFFCTILLEGTQKFFCYYATFDWFDIVFQILASVIALLIYYFIDNYQRRR